MPKHSWFAPARKAGLAPVAVGCRFIAQPRNGRAAQSGFVFAVSGGIAAFVGSFALGFLPRLLARLRMRTPEFASGLFTGVLANAFGAAAMLAPNPVTATVFLTLAFLTMTAPYIVGLSMINCARAISRPRHGALYDRHRLDHECGRSCGCWVLVRTCLCRSEQVQSGAVYSLDCHFGGGAIVMIAGRSAYERMVAHTRQELENAASRGALYGRRATHALSESAGGCARPLLGCAGGFKQLSDIHDRIG